MRSADGRSVSITELTCFGTHFILSSGPQRYRRLAFDGRRTETFSDLVRAILPWINQEQGRARFYSLMIKRDLFGRVELVRNSSQIGTHGRELAEEFAGEIEAGQAPEAVAGAKRRRGSCDLSDLPSVEFCIAWVGIADLPYEIEDGGPPGESRSTYDHSGNRMTAAHKAIDCCLVPPAEEAVEFSTEVNLYVHKCPHSPSNLSRTRAPKKRPALVAGRIRRT
jgi:predicted DNA-binding WGR domain protein